MQYALDNNIKVDTFVVITDNDTWAGPVHPHEALNIYRNKMHIAARMIVLGCVPNKFSIADPSDAGSLDLVGFDSSTPKIVADFSAGRI